MKYFLTKTETTNSPQCLTVTISPQVLQVKSTKHYDFLTYVRRFVYYFKQAKQFQS